MTVEQKVGQLVQADISTITPKDLETYPLGSILAGGNSGPNGNERSTAADWAKLVGDFRTVSLRPQANGVAIPIIFGVDAVHGHNNIPGATLFPHNIGLGAARDPELIQRIGAVTAAEIAGSGIEWTFAPTLAVPQDLRWGRSYEGYASDPGLIAEYAKAMVLGLQGPLVAGKAVGAQHVAATAKHFLADGGTFEGKDQGDAKVDEKELIAKHAMGYPAAIDAGALTVMASFFQLAGRQASRQQGAAHRRAQGQDGLCGLRRRRLERARAGCGMQRHRLRAVDQRGARHVHGARQLERALRQHAETCEGRHDIGGAARRRGAAHPARQIQARPLSRRPCRSQHRENRRHAATFGGRAGSGRQIARPAQEQRQRPAGQARRARARHRPRGRQHGDPVGRMDDQLAGDGRYPRRFPQWPDDLGGAGQIGA